MAGSFVAGGVVQPPAAGEGLKLVGRSLPRSRAFWEGRTQTGGAGTVRISLSRRDLKHTQSPGCNL